MAPCGHLNGGVSKTGPLESTASHRCWAQAALGAGTEQGGERPGTAGESGFLFWHRRAGKGTAVTGLSFLDSWELSHRLMNAKPLSLLPPGLALACGAHQGTRSTLLPLSHIASQHCSPSQEREARSGEKEKAKGRESLACAHGVAMAHPSPPHLFLHPSRANRRHATQTLAATWPCTNP